MVGMDDSFWKMLIGLFGVLLIVAQIIGVVANYTTAKKMGLAPAQKDLVETQNELLEVQEKKLAQKDEIIREQQTMMTQYQRRLSVSSKEIEGLVKLGANQALIYFAALEKACKDPEFCAMMIDNLGKVKELKGELLDEIHKNMEERGAAV